MTSDEKLFAAVSFDCGYDQGHEDGKDNERERIAAWLRGGGFTRDFDIPWRKQLADAIETGEYARALDPAEVVKGKP